MRKTIASLLLVSTLVIMPGAANAEGSHALGDMYTTALNMIERDGMLNDLGLKREISIDNMHVDQGQVFVTLTGDNKSVTVVYDPIAHKLLTHDEKTK